MSSQSTPKKPRHTVSFLGITIALVGIATLATIGIPMWFAQPNITLQSAAELLVQDIRQVQEQAVIAHMPCRIEFDADGGGYSAVASNGEPLEAPLGNGPYRRDFGADAVFRGVTHKAANFAGRTALSFDGRGYAEADGSIELHFRGAMRLVRYESGTPFVEEPTQNP